MLGDGFEGQQEAGEVGVMEESADLIEGENGGAVVAGAEIGEGFRRDRAFEVEVELSFGKAAKEGVRNHGGQVSG
jgi:hypothetical protein